MNPFGIIVSLQDELFDPEQDRRILPAAGLAVDIEPGNRTANHAPLTERINLSVDVFHITERYGGVFREDIDIRFFLDHPVCDPGRVLIAL
ncbi:hypothetical protein ES703_53904 [subsurface metagenome]